MTYNVHGTFQSHIYMRPRERDRSWFMLIQSQLVACFACLTWYIRTRFNECFFRFVSMRVENLRDFHSTNMKFGTRALTERRDEIGKKSRISTSVGHETSSVNYKQSTTQADNHYTFWLHTRHHTHRQRISTTRPTMFWNEMNRQQSEIQKSNVKN